MVSAIKLPVFRGVGNEELDQFWFMVKAVLEAQGVLDDNVKKATLVSALQDHALMWYIKCSNDNPSTGIIEFSKAKSETRSIIGFKEIAMLPSEAPWELDQRLKCMIREANMTLMDG